jgi:site-specific DNA-methyltransferase (adenine-specific)
METNKIYQGDCLELMKDIPDGSVDLVVTDPPYNLKKFKGDDFTEEEFKIFSLKWLNECYRVLKENGLLFFTFWSDGMYEMYNIIKQTNFNFIQTLIWYYPNISGFKGKQQYTRTFDPIFVLSKSKPRKLNIQKGSGFGTADCWNMLKICKPQSNYKKDKLIHPTQKPKELFKRIIIENSDEGDLILDPFCGVGTFLYGCENRKYIGFEINPEYTKIINERLS